MAYAELEREKEAEDAAASREGIEDVTQEDIDKITVDEDEDG